MTYTPIVIEITQADVELWTSRTVTDQEWSDFVDEWGHNESRIPPHAAAKRIAEDFNEMWSAEATADV